MPEIGPAIRRLNKVFGLTQEEMQQLSARYTDKELTGPAEFMEIMVSASSNPQVKRILGARVTKLKIELTDLLLKAKAILLADGPDALGKYLDNHPFLNYLR